MRLGGRAGALLSVELSPRSAALRDRDRMHPPERVLSRAWARLYKKERPRHTPRASPAPARHSVVRACASVASSHAHSACRAERVVLRRHRPTTARACSNSAARSSSSRCSAPSWAWPGTAMRSAPPSPGRCARPAAWHSRSAARPGDAEPRRHHRHSRLARCRRNTAAGPCSRPARAHARGARITSICSGVFVLAHAPGCSRRSAPPRTGAMRRSWRRASP